MDGHPRARANAARRAACSTRRPRLPPFVEIETWHEPRFVSSPCTHEPSGWARLRSRARPSRVERSRSAIWSTPSSPESPAPTTDCAHRAAAWAASAPTTTTAQARRRPARRMLTARPGSAHRRTGARRRRSTARPWGPRTSTALPVRRTRIAAPRRAAATTARVVTVPIRSAKEREPHAERRLTESVVAVVESDENEAACHEAVRVRAVCSPRGLLSRADSDEHQLSRTWSRRSESGREPSDSGGRGERAEALPSVSERYVGVPCRPRVRRVRSGPGLRNVHGRSDGLYAVRRLEHAVWSSGRILRPPRGGQRSRGLRGEVQPRAAAMCEAGERRRRLAVSPSDEPAIGAANEHLDLRNGRRFARIVRRSWSSPSCEPRYFEKVACTECGVTVAMLRA
jgi:hypothetical protein